MESTTGLLESGGFGLERSGAVVLRYGLALILLWIGGLKFTAYEAKDIEPLVSNSPFLSWAYHAFGLQGIAKLLGVTEILFGLLICLRPVNARSSAWGSLGAVVMFLTTLSLLFTTPGVIAPDYTFPVLSGHPGQFIAKDLVLLGAALWTAGEALRASRIEPRERSKQGR
jgi:uncharacterized membrane protein YkgB